MLAYEDGKHVLIDRFDTDVPASHPVCEVRNGIAIEVCRKSGVPALDQCGDVLIDDSTQLTARYPCTVASGNR